MAFIAPKFQDITMNVIGKHEASGITCKIGLAKFNERFRLAQIWLDRKMMEKMTPFVPYKTGAFLGRIQAENAGKWGTGEIVTAVPPQGRYLYPGFHYKTGKPFNWTNPQTQPRWGTYTYQTYKADFNRGIKHILLTGRYPDG